MNTSLNIPDEIQEMFRPLLADTYSLKYNGKRVDFALKRNKHLYNYFTGKSGAQYCYT